MGFEELGDGLTDWLEGWIDKVSGGATVSTPSAESLGEIVVSIFGELIKLDLTAEAGKATGDALSRAIEQAYTDAYRESFRQLGMVFDRLEHDVADDGPLLAKVRTMRADYSDPGALQRLLRHRQAYRENATWDPAADPLRRNV